MTVLLGALGLLGPITLSLAAGLLLARRAQAPAQASPPGPGQAPVPGSATPPARQRQLPAPAPGHGGDVKVIVVKGDGRVETTDCATGHTEIWPGDCGACATGEGACSLCAFWTVFDPLRGRWVRRYQRCPAHTDRERQP